jgi:hypothetical protein
MAAVKVRCSLWYHSRCFICTTICTRYYSEAINMAYTNDGSFSERYPITSSHKVQGTTMFYVEKIVSQVCCKIIFIGRVRDLWSPAYLYNGTNVNDIKDIGRQNKNIDDGVITFIRSKKFKDALNKILEANRINYWISLHEVLFAYNDNGMISFRLSRQQK